MKSIYTILLVLSTTCQAQDTLPWSMQNYTAFVKSLQPQLDEMAEYQVVGLGEGTHGTSEFQTIRAYITRYLTEEKGFNVVFLENSYGPTAELNRYLQTGEGRLEARMRKDLFGMWQNREMRSMFQWMRDYNTRSAQKIHIMGMDIALIAANGALIKQITDKWHDARIDSLVSTLVTCCNYMDAAWASQNKGRKRYPWKNIVQNCARGYETVVALQDVLPGTDTSLQTALYNCRLAFHSIYQPPQDKKAARRDEAMANMVKRAADIIPNAKIIVWAHQAHLARKNVLGKGGVTGSFLASYFPGRYFVVGTGTAGGTVCVTRDRFIVNTSRFRKQILPAAPNSSWEYTMNGDHVYFDLTGIDGALPEKILRFAGYGTDRRNDYFKVQLNALFDGFFFIRKTRGTNMLH